LPTFVVASDQVSYYSFSDPFISNISGSTKIVQINLTLVSEYQPEIYDNVKKHRLAIVGAINQFLYSIDEQQYKIQSRLILSEKICAVINKILLDKVRFGGIKEVIITDIVVR